jgi:hypothetical protein
MTRSGRRMHADGTRVVGFRGSRGASPGEPWIVLDDVGSPGAVGESG